MTQDLYRLVYYSRNAIVADIDSLGIEVDAILAASRRNNAAAGITGALLFNSGCFGQVLEGTRRAIEATFERIQCDARHGDVSLLAFDPASERSFPRWSMGFVGGRPDHTERFAGIASGSGFDPSAMSGERLFDTLVRLALEDEQSRAA